MSLHKISGNLLTLAAEGKFDWVLHGCNCHHTFGSGIARSIAEKWPAAAAADRKTRWGDRRKLGIASRALITTEARPFYIVNVYTQFGVSSEKDQFEYEAFERYLFILAEVTKLSTKPVQIGMPYIGSGRANGDWQRIEKLIETFAESNADVYLVDYRPHVPLDPHLYFEI
jgi:O-acetyl-ADP-ribose deacetylase (regulator of RNase III)